MNSNGGSGRAEPTRRWPEMTILRFMKPAASKVGPVLMAADVFTKQFPRASRSSLRRDRCPVQKHHCYPNASGCKIIHLTGVKAYRLHARLPACSRAEDKGGQCHANRGNTRLRAAALGSPRTQGHR